MAASTLEEKLDKIKSPALEGQKKTQVVLEAVESTLKEQNTPRTPTSYFAALLALLSQSINNGQTKGDTTTSVVYLLDIVTPFTPQPLLRAKFTQILSLLAPVLLLQDAEAPLLKWSVGCLESLLIAQDSAAWELSTAQIGPRRAVAGLLNLALDHRPKVRKRVQDALRNVLRSPPPSPSLDHPAADLCAQTALAKLAELAAQATSTRKNKKSADAAHEPAMIHALQLVKTIASASGGWPSKKIESLCELLLGIAKTGNEYMTTAVFDIFEMIFEGMADEVASAKLPRLMEIISELRPLANDTQLVPPWLAILSRGFDVSAQIEPEETFQKLPEVFEMVVSFMGSPSQNIRISASECLVSFMANCVPRQVIQEPSIYDEKILEKVAKLGEPLLSVRYQSAWVETFKVLGAIFDSLRWRASPMMLNVVKTLGEIRANEAFRSKKEADEVIGKAIRAMGPGDVLSVLPLNLTKSGRGKQGRAWMMPLLRDYTSNTVLAHFRSEMVPLSEFIFQKIIDHGGAEKTMEIKIYETLVHQAWSTLPGYCDLPLDLLESFDQSFAELLAKVLYEQVELRLDVCRGLRTLVESNQAIANTEDEEDMVLQSRVSRDTATKNLEYLGSFAGNMLAVLFNVYTQTLPQTRGPILQSINAFLSIAPTAELMETFNLVREMLTTELQKTKEEKATSQENPNKLPSTSNALMDLVITMSVYLPRDCFANLFEISSVIIFKQNEPQLQKKAYKLIPRLTESEIGKTALGERLPELEKMLFASADSVTAPARKDRLAAISALLPFVPNKSLHFIPAVLSEVVICCKEQNEGTRAAAFELLIQMGYRMSSSNGALIDNSKVPHMSQDAPKVTANMEEYFTMVSAGLAGSTPHMISATITALSRTLYEFRGQLADQTIADLVQTMDLFLTSNNREIVRSVLGFVKVCVIGLRTELMLPRLPTLVPNLIIWSHEHKAHFKLKVKHLLERMVRKFGYDNIYKNCPEADRKLIINIRKTRDRSKKQRDAARDGQDEDGSDEEADRPSRRFESEYDQALYSSESEESDAEEPSKPAKGKKGGRKGGNTYIVEDEHEPLDLLGKQAFANISSTKPVKLRQPVKSKAKVDEDGKLILGKENDVPDGMDIDVPNPEESGVGAYVAALKGKDVAKRGRQGKLKFSNRRSNHDEDDDEQEMDGKDALAVKTRLAKQSPNGKSRGMPRPGRGGRSGRGGIAAGRRGLGVDKRRGPAMSAAIGKPFRGRR